MLKKRMNYNNRFKQIGLGLLLMVLTIGSLVLMNASNSYETFNEIEQMLKTRRYHYDAANGKLTKRYATDKDESVYELLFDLKKTNLLSKSNRLVFKEGLIFNNLVREILLKLEHESAMVGVPMICEYFAKISELNSFSLSQQEKDKLFDIRQDISKVIQQHKYLNIDKILADHDTDNKILLKETLTLDKFIKKINKLNIKVLKDYDDLEDVNEIVKNDPYRKILKLKNKVDETLDLLGMYKIMEKIRSIWVNELSFTLASKEAMDATEEGKDIDVNKFPAPTRDQLSRCINLLGELESHLSRHVYANAKLTQLWTDQMILQH